MNLFLQQLTTHFTFVIVNIRDQQIHNQYFSKFLLWLYIEID